MAKEEIKTNEVKVENKEQDNVEYSDDEILTPENKAILRKKSLNKQRLILL